MQSLIAIPSNSLDKNTEMLVDPKKMDCLHGYSGAFKILKTEIYTSCKDWDVQLVTDRNARTIFSSSQLDKAKCCKPFNLPELIGHGFSIMPWQKLQIRFNDGCGTVVSYIEDTIDYNA